MQGPQLAFSEELHAMKYRGLGESFSESASRIAGPITDGSAHYHYFRRLLIGMSYMPAGRIQASVGSPKTTTAHNCFVSGTIADSLTQGEGSIMQRLAEAAETMRQGGGDGFDFSPLRPRGHLIKKLNSEASGPVSFMKMWDAMCKTISSAGHRRGAMMAVFRCDHPDIEEFVRAKNNRTELTTFNTSILVTDHFMECVRDNKPFMLRFNDEDVREIDAGALWDIIMRSTWDWAEPGIIFVDRVNEMNNLWYCEEISCSNPCGEQPLPPDGACLLGSQNLVKYLSRRTITEFEFDYEQFKLDIPSIVRAMDNVIDLAKYPLEAQREEGINKRRMGLGVTGLANTGEALGHPYGSPGFVEFTDKVLSLLAAEAYRASAYLAEEKGAFPFFRRDEYLESKFVKTLPEDVRELIYKHGIRNSHLTSIAPTGTISMCADNISSGIEPVFAYSFERDVNTPQGVRKETIEDYGVRVLGVRGKVSSEVTAEEHLAVLAVAQKNVDSAVSKTCNVGDNVEWDDFKHIYMSAWERGCKGCTTYREEGERGSIFNNKEKEEGEVLFGGPPGGSMSLAAGLGSDGATCYIDEATGRHECD